MHNPFITALAGIALLAPPAMAYAEDALTLNALSPEHREQVTCVMLAGVAVTEIERGARKQAYGLDQDDLERLGEGLAGVLGAAYGADAEATRALLNADYEDLTRRTMEFAEEDEYGPSVSFDELAQGCKAYWEAGALPPPPSYRDRPVDAWLCFALEATFSQALVEQAGRDTDISMTFARRANRIEADLLEEAGEDEAAREDVRHALLAAIDGFDVPAWDALPEEEAEPIMMWCDQLAGPDE